MKKNQLLFLLTLDGDDNHHKSLIKDIIAYHNSYSPRPIVISHFYEVFS